MKFFCKRALTSLLLFCIPLASWSQTIAPKYRILLEGPLGFPSAADAYMILSPDFTWQQNSVWYERKGPWALRADYLISRRWGLGLEYQTAYNRAQLSFRSQDYRGNWSTDSVSYSCRRTRLYLRGTLHLGKARHWDPYFLFSGGYCRYDITYRDLTRGDEVHSHRWSDIGLDELDRALAHGPVGGRVAFGLRWLPVKYLGLGMEISVGGPLLSGGLNLRF